MAFLVFVRHGALGGDSITVYAMFRDASGLGKRSRVQVAGIPVGDIQDISLVGTRARVKLRLRKDIGLRTDAVLIKRTESFLGDYLLDLQVGTPEAPPMPDGGEITRVIDQQGLQALFDTLGKITTRHPDRSPPRCARPWVATPGPSRFRPSSGTSPSSPSR